VTAALARALTARHTAALALIAAGDTIRLLTWAGRATPVDQYRAIAARDHYDHVTRYVHTLEEAC